MALYEWIFVNNGHWAPQSRTKWSPWVPGRSDSFDESRRNHNGACRDLAGARSRRGLCGSFAIAVLAPAPGPPLDSATL
eukprot:5389078-Prymnesium_polylepis.2